MSTVETRILHLHVPKTAGTAIRVAFGLPRHNLKVFPHYSEHLYKDAVADEYDVFSGHYGYDTAARLGGRIITVIRNPFDRFISTYYFWRDLYERGVERSRHAELAARFSLDEFAQILDDAAMLAEFYNRATWQIAGNTNLAYRMEKRGQGWTDEDVFALACRNLTSFSLVGIQERMRDFKVGLERRFGIFIVIRQVNVTKARLALADVPLPTRRHIYRWVAMDMALYEQALAISFQPHLHPPNPAPAHAG
jgi:hypothetical protein